MKLALVYNVYDSVSGESTFFGNMLSGMRGKGFDVIDCGIRQDISGLMGKFDYYSRVRVLRDTRAALRKIRPDVVHFLNAALAPAADALRGPKKVATSHFVASSYFQLSPPQNPLAKIAESAFCRYAEALDRPAFQSMDALVACTEYQRMFLEKNFALKNCLAIPPGIDAAYFSKLPKRDLASEFGAEKIVVCAGRLHERSKGVSYAIRAMKHLEGMKLLVIGDGPDRNTYVRLAEREGLADSVRFLGRLDFGEKSIIQKSADVAVIPSLYEVYGTVFAEAIACGTPVCAFDQPFWKGLYDGAGIFARPRDEKALAVGIRTLAADVKAREALVSRYPAITANNDVKKTIEAYAELYSSLA
ncbi:MAG: glycosyltransferase family 4 protein [Candidatus Micrarchaeota archaeon]